jgi:signal transduction histidine kinase
MAVKLDQLRNDPTMQLPGGNKSFEELLQQTNEITEDVHRLSHRLHSGALNDLGLVPAIRHLVTEFSQHQHIEVEFTFSSVPKRLPSAVALCLFRVAEESLNNIAKHSGAASARVHLAGDADGIHLAIEDAGAGFDAKAVEGRAGLGFVSMRERCRLVQGSVFVHSSPSKGTRIEVRIPSKSVNVGAAGADDPTTGEAREDQ